MVFRQFITKTSEVLKSSVIKNSPLQLLAQFLKAFHEVNKMSTSGEMFERRKQGIEHINEPEKGLMRSLLIPC